MHANKPGKRLLKCGAEILVAGLKHVPIIGVTIEFIDDCIQVADKLKKEQQARGQYTPDDIIFNTKSTSNELKNIH